MAPRSRPPSQSAAAPIPMVVVAASGAGNSNQDVIIPDFALCAALVGHTGDVRSLAAGKGYLYSGARDSMVMAWPLDEVSPALAASSAGTSRNFWIPEDVSQKMVVPNPS